MRVEYEILVATCPAVLQELVQEKLRGGWDCQGGVAIGIDHPDPDFSAFTYTQAMIKRYQRENH